MSRKTTSTFWFPMLLLFAALWAGQNVFGFNGDAPRAFPLTEDFESGATIPTTWSVYNVDAGGATWTLSPTINHTPGGSKSAFHNFSSGNQNGWLVTPALALPASGLMFATFWNSNIDPSYYGKNSVLISTTGSDPATANYVELWSPATVTEEWEKVVLNLAAYAGQTVHIAFRYEGDFAHAWSIDDVYIGNDVNTSPKIEINPNAITAVAPLNGSSTKNLNIKNTGIDDLTYSLVVSYTGTTEGFLTAAPLTGTVTGSNSQAVVLTFNATVLELGSYTALIQVTSNDPDAAITEVPVTLNVIEGGNIEVHVMVQDYTFPSDISENGQWVPITAFGGGSSVWQKGVGEIPVNGEELIIQAVSENGIVSGNKLNPDVTVGGNGVQMSGYYNAQNGEWTFLPINPAAGNPTTNDYNSNWGMSADGLIHVGMQYMANGSYRAYKWTEADGFEMIGNALSSGNRPNGISNDGSVVYGWADMPSVSRSPVIWYNNEVIQIAPDTDGEAFGASSDGSYVVGTVEEEVFIWTPQGVTFFQNTLNQGMISPTCVADDGTVFGFTADGWPPFPDVRRAFARTTDGELMTFNDYAFSLGMFDAADWLFYSINGVTPDGTKFIGAGINPDGQTVSFMIDFSASIPAIQITPDALSEELLGGETSTQTLTVANTGNAPLNFEVAINYVPSGMNMQHAVVPQGPTQEVSDIDISKTSSKGGSPITTKSRDGYVLHYDGDNVDAIGANAGGDIFTMVRFPQELVSGLAGATISSVDVYVNDLPNLATLIIREAGTTTTPGAIIHEQLFVPTAWSWNTVSLTLPLVLTGNDIWIGCHYIHDAGAYVAGVDGGPVNPNGDFISMDGLAWDRLSDFGFNNNWNLRANLQLGTGNWLSIDPSAATVEGGSTIDLSAHFDAGILGNGDYFASLIFSSNASSNSTLVIPVSLNVQGSEICYPTPRNLAGTTAGQDVTLTWQVPDFGGGGPTTDFVEDFEAGTLPTGWVIYNVDGDAYNWENTAVNFSVFPAHTGLYCMTSASYVNNVGALTPNNWLVTPGIAVTAASELKFWIAGQDPAYAAEQYYVKVSTSGNAVADFTTTLHMAVSTGTWQEIVVNLSAYAGQTIYLAFQHADVTDMFYLKLDDVSVTATATRSAQTARVAAGLSTAIPFKTLDMSASQIESRLHPQTAYVFGEAAELAPLGGTSQITPEGIKHQSGSRSRALLYDNGPFINSPGGGAGGADASILQVTALGMTTLGAGIQFASGNHMADDFVVDQTWDVESFTFYAYQTGSTTTSTMTGGYLQIWDGDPTAGGQIIYGDMTTNVMASTAWTNAYRFSDTQPGSTRPVMGITCSTPGLTLEPGTYWVEYTLAGTLASGPWAPPITINGLAVTGNAKQFLGTDLTWVDFLDTGTGTPAQGLPFLIEGEVGSTGPECPHGELLGYNVLRNGTKIGETVASVRTYVDASVAQGTYSYGVTAVYGEPYPGESGQITTSVTVDPVVLDPNITVTPAALQFWTPLSGSQSQPMTMGNTGQGPLSWTATVQYVNRLVEPQILEEGIKGDLSHLSFTKANTAPGGSPATDSREVVVLNYDGDNADAIGLTGGGAFTVAARFPAAMVAPYAGYSLESVDVYINDVPTNSTLKVWAAGTNSAPGALLAEQAFTGTALSWMTITLNNALTLTGQDIWVGYSVTHADAAFPAGTDAGPANPNGDFISTDGVAWDHLAGFGLNYNWNIRAKLSSGNGYSWLSLATTSGTIAPGATSVVTATANSAGLGAGEYLANVKIMSNDPDTPVKMVPVALHVGVGLSENAMDNIKVYPIPATSQLTIELVQGVETMRLVNFMGQTVLNTQVKGQLQQTLNIENLRAGAYTLQFVNTNGETFNRTVIINR